MSPRWQLCFEGFRGDNGLSRVIKTGPISLTFDDRYPIPNIGLRAVDQLIWRLSHRAAPRNDIGVEPDLLAGPLIARIDAVAAAWNSIGFNGSL
jgi:hypothetical protein